MLSMENVHKKNYQLIPWAVPQAQENTAVGFTEYSDSNAFKTVKLSWEKCKEKPSVKTCPGAREHVLLLQRTRVQVTAPTLSSFPVTLVPRDPVSFLASRALYAHAQTYNQTNMHTHNLKK